ncbi:MAG: tetratricopeptide repeat protein [Armatimonadia bacterium]
MNWIRYSGRIILALGVIAIGVWATTNELVDKPVTKFWLGLMVYLVAAELAWTLADYYLTDSQSRLPRRGLLRLASSDRFILTLNSWLYDGGRCRYVDILTKQDVLRDAHQSLQAAVLTRESRPRVHLLPGAVGTGRSTLLLRLARILAENSQTVFVGLPGPEIAGLETVIETARNRQVYLFIDDLDLQPQAEEWLYEIYRSQLPIVVVATTSEETRPQYGEDKLAAVRPAGLLAEGTAHPSPVTPNDLAELARKLQSLGRMKRQEVAVGTTTDLLEATRYMQGWDPKQGLWQDLDRGPKLAQEQKVMLALCGAAELAIPESLYGAIFGEKAIGRWAKANLVSLQHCHALPPHHKVCLDLVRELDPASETVHGALDKLTKLVLPVMPAFAVRLLYGLAKEDTLRHVARAQVQAMQGQARESWPQAVQRAWRRVLEELDLVTADLTQDESYPPELLIAMSRAFDRKDYEGALAAAQKLAKHELYESAAGFNIALALCHLGRLEEAGAVLAKLKSKPPGTHYLRGLIAESRGDWPAALDEYEESRKADEVQLMATRQLAFAYLKSGAPRAALPLFEAALLHTPKSADLYGGLAVAYLQAGMAQRAAAQSARAIQAGVEPSEARKAVASACAEVRAYSRVAAELEACVSYESGDLEAWSGLATACRWLGRFEREAQCLEQLQEAQPMTDDLRLQMARNQRDLGHPETALELLQPLLTADQPPLPALLLAAEVVAGNNDPVLQETLAQQAVAQGEASGWAQYWLGDSETLSGRTEQASEHYREAVRRLKAQVNEGVTPGRAAKCWQAIYLSAVQLGDEDLAREAARKARQEAAICEALGAEVESVVHHRAVPTALFLESLPSTLPAGPPSEPAEAPPAPNQPEVRSFRKGGPFRARG